MYIYEEKMLESICNRLSSPVADIVLFGFWVFLYGLTLKIFKTRLLGRGFHTLKCFVSLSNRCEISQSTPIMAQRPRWHSFLTPIDVGSHSPPPSEPNILVGTRSSLQLMWDLTIHPFGASVLASTPFGVWLRYPFVTTQVHR